MKPIIEDDRTEEERHCLRYLVVGTDKFLSGWGRAENRVSYAAWACRWIDLPVVEQWVRSRSDMQRVRVVEADKYRPRGAVHLHIYVWRQG